MDYTRDRTVMVFRKRVRRFAGRREMFGRGGQYRSANGLQWVVPVQEAREVGCDRHRKLMAGMGHGQSLLFGRRENAAQRFDVADAGAQLPSPVVPLCGACLWEESFSESGSSRAAAKPREMRCFLDGYYFWVFFDFR
jgi:hypothetical protein